MTPFASDQWVMLALMFVLGLLLGMAFFAGGKWKRRYRAEAERSAELERENERLRRETREMDSLRGAATRHPVNDEPGRGPL